jgi:hypothetical protein
VPAGPLSLAGLTAAEASRRLLAYVEARLAEGASGHLDALRALSEHVFDRTTAHPGFRGSEEELAPLLYDWVRMAVTREAQVVALSETVFRSMAESPAALADLEGDTIESFTEGIGPMLPGVLDAEALERFRGYARRTLEAPEESQPSSVRSNRNRLKRLLEGSWAPDLTVEEARTRLRQPGLRPDEALGILRRLPAEAWPSVDVAAVLGPGLDAGDWGVLRVLPRGLPYDAATRSALDARALTPSQGKKAHWLYRYLGATGRSAWTSARPFLEEGLSRGGPVADECAMALAQFQPPKEDVRALLDRYAVSEKPRTFLRSAFRLDE